MVVVPGVTAAQPYECPELIPGGLKDQWDLGAPQAEPLLNVESFSFLSPPPL